MNQDSILESFRSIVRSELESLRLNYSGQYDYTIDNVNGEQDGITIDCSPVDDSIGLPSLSNVQLQRGINGTTGTPDSGKHCTLVFLNRDPAKPRITGWDHIGDTPLARVGDQVSCCMPMQIQIYVVAGVPGYIPFTGYLQLLNQNLTGFITSGSEVDFSG